MLTLPPYYDLKCVLWCPAQHLFLFHFKMCYELVLAEALIPGEDWFNCVILTTVMWKRQVF